MEPASRKLINFVAVKAHHCSAQIIGTKIKSALVSPTARGSGDLHQLTDCQIIFLGWRFQPVLANIE